MVDTKHVFQISGIKIPLKKGRLLHGIHQLGGKYIGGSVYNQNITHLLVTHPLASEKFLASCAGGKWIVSTEYILDSVKHGAWLPEEPYELDIASQIPETTNPLRAWREKIAGQALTGAFLGWRVVLAMENTNQRDIFRRILKAGMAKVFYGKAPPSCAVTHVLTKHGTECIKPHNAPLYSVSHIAQHLFGNLWFEMGLTWSLWRPTHTLPEREEELPEEEEEDEDLFAELQTELRDHISKLENQKKGIAYKEFMIYCTASSPSQAPGADFSNVLSLTECGFFTQALEEIQGGLRPGQLPPASALQAALQHALHGDATPHCLAWFRTVLHDILRNNPSWGSPNCVKFFSLVLQCPQCKKGVWSLLETLVRSSMCSSSSCHPLPNPKQPDLIRFNGDLQEFVLKLFQTELQTANARGREIGGSRSSVLYSTFWTIWEKAILGSRAVRQLAELLIQVVVWALPSSEDWQVRMVSTLQGILSVVVDYWCQEQSHFNRGLVEKGLWDLAEHTAILCQDTPLDAIRSFVPGIPSLRFRMVVADALFRSVCCQNGMTLGTEPLSLLKIVSSYLSSLGRLCECGPAGPPGPRADNRGPWPKDEPASTSCTSQGARLGVKSCHGNRIGPEKENIPRGIHRVNAAGETLLHRACKTNQVEVLCRALTLPGIEVNVKDHAGWTPLHEACNHGSSDCVEALLIHCPTLDLHCVVDGLSPLHDALLRGHQDIANMLLRHTGSSLLNQRDGRGLTALDLVTSEALRNELSRSALEGDSARETRGSVIRNLPFLETCSCLLSCLLLSYQLERHVPSFEARDGPLSLGSRLARALSTHSARRMMVAWTDATLARHVEDLETMLQLGQYLRQVRPAVNECQEPHTHLLMTQLEGLQQDGRAFLEGTWR